jgi:hypothetical protein
LGKKKKDDAQDKLINLQAAQLAAQVAKWAAQLEFSKERFRLLEMPQFQQMSQLEVDKLAFAKAEATWRRSYEEASITGMYNGMPTTEWLTQQAQLTGVLNGQQTLQGKLTDAQIAQMEGALELQNKQLLLEYEKFGFTQRQWDDTFGLQQGELTGYYGGKETLAREQFKASSAQNYLGLLASLQGPGNAFKQLRVLQNTPGGLRDLAANWSGQYQMGEQGVTGQAPGQAQVSDLMSGWGGQGGYSGYGAFAPGAAPVPSTGDPNHAAGKTGMVSPTAPVARTDQVIPSAATGGAGFAPNGAGGYGVIVPLRDPVPAPPPPNMTPEQIDAWEAQYPNYAIDPSDPRGYSEWTPEMANAQYAVGQPPTMNQMPGYTYSPPGQPAPPNAYNYTMSPGGSTSMYPPGVMAPPAAPTVSTTTPVSPGAAQTMVAPGADPNAYSLLPSQINAENYANTNVFAQKLGWAAFDDQGWDVEAAQDAFKKSLPKYGGPASGTFKF